MIWLKFTGFCYRLIPKSFQNPLLQRLIDYWLSRSFQVKLSILLILSAALPTILATQGVILVAKNQLEEREAKSVQKGLADFQYHVEHINNDYHTHAQVLQQRLEQAEIDMSNSDALAQNQELVKILSIIPLIQNISQVFMVILLKPLQNQPKNQT